MNGQTNAGGSAGGLKVVAEGTTTDISRTIDLPVAPKLVYVCFLESHGDSTELWAVAVPQQNVFSTGSAGFLVQFNSPTQIFISSPMAGNFYYLVLG